MAQAGAIHQCRDAFGQLGQLLVGPSLGEVAGGDLGRQPRLGLGHQHVDNLWTGTPLAVATWAIDLPARRSFSRSASLIPMALATVTSPRLAPPWWRPGPRCQPGPSVEAPLGLGSGVSFALVRARAAPGPASRRATARPPARRVAPMGRPNGPCLRWGGRPASASTRKRARERRARRAQNLNHPNSSQCGLQLVKTQPDDGQAVGAMGDGHDPPLRATALGGHGEGRRRRATIRDWAASWRC